MKKDLYTGLGKTLGDNLDWKFEYERQMREEENKKERKIKQMIDNRDMVDKLNDLNHDYQRMRKLAKRRINGRLTKFNKDRAREEKEVQRKLGSEAWIDVRHGWVVKLVWVAVGVIIGLWLH
jgi:hypothetical protein